MSSLAGKLFGWLLRSFPEQRRGRYGAEMRDAFQRQTAALVRERGRLSALRFVMLSYIDVVHTGFQERARENRRYPLSKDGWLTGLGLDLRHAVRSLSNSWTFTGVCLASLAIGLAINAILVLFMNLTFDPPRAVKADGAVELLITTGGRNLDDLWSYPDFADVKRTQTGLELSAFVTGTRDLRADSVNGGGPVNVLYVSANYFQVLGVAIAPGRGFTPEEDQVGSEPPVIISNRFWRNRLNNDPAIVGRTLRLNRQIARVVGVAPAGFDGHSAGHSAEVWLPLWTHPAVNASSPIRTDRGADWLEVVGRLQRDVSITQANRAVQSVMAGIAEAHPASNKDRRAIVVPYTVQGGGNAHEGLLARTMFLGLSGMVLFVVCLNLTGMVTVRTAARQRELALRLAMGSSRMRLMRHLLMESAVIALLGGLLSSLLMAVLLRVMGAQVGQPIPVDVTITAVAVCVGLSALTTIVIGLSPALRFSRPALLASLKEDAGSGKRRSGRIHKIATSVQTAIALPLLIINGMFLQGTRVMSEGDYGFKVDNLLVAKIDLDVEGYPEHAVESFLRQARERVDAVPGVTAVTIGDAVPLDYERRSRRLSRAGEEEYVYAGATRITENYFETIGTPILLGRSILPTDVRTAEAVAVVTKSLAERLWPGQNALGRRVRYGFDRSSQTEVTVVGVVADVAGSSHESAPTNIFVSLWQQPTRRITLVTRVSSQSVIPEIRRALIELDPNMTRPVILTSRALIEGAKREIYAGTAFVGGLSVLTLLLAAIGVYGVVAFAVATRTREIGLRMAVGASRVSVLRMVLLDGVKLAVPGIVVGSLVAAFLAHAILERWYAYLKMATLNPVVLVLGASVALLTVLFACSMPARRAASVQPMEALRVD
jgi:predicted permease